MSGYLYAGMAALQLAGSHFAAENIKETAALNREIAEMNAEFAELDAYDAEIAGYGEVARYQSVIDQTLGAQKAELAAAGVDTSYGTAAAIEDETNLIAQLNKMEIMNQAEKAALGYKTQARQFRVGGYLETVNAKNDIFSTRLQGVTGAANTGLSGYRASRS